ncbi:MAG: hypothetical protein ABI398_06400 [Devosia sp.]
MPNFVFNLIGMVFTIVGAVWTEEAFRHGGLHPVGGAYASAVVAMPAIGILVAGLMLMLGAAILHHLGRIDRHTEFSGRALAEISESEIYNHAAPRRGDIE